jgi:LysM repeat protein
MSVTSKPFTVFLLIVSLTLVVGTLAAAADPLIHVVEKGETLYAISRKYDVPLDSIMKLNGITDPGKLFAGMKLTIPAGVGSGTVAVPSTESSNPVTVDYVVKKGDTLFSIAKANGITVDSILKASGTASTTLKVGQILKIPVKPPSTTDSGSKPAAVIPVATAVSAGSTAKTWPASGQVSYLQGKLKGVSIAAAPAASIQAIRSGMVISAGPFRGFGLVAFVQANDGLVYVYGGAGNLNVKIGDSIRKGALIGKVQDERDASVYFFVFKGPDTIDPDTALRD